jgi:transcriptional regulator
LHPSGVFRQITKAVLERFVADTGFGLIFAASRERLFAAHAPVLLGDDKLRFHLSSANALTAALEKSGTGLAVLTGPHAYISPDWYGAPDQVPTWNYLSAEIEGPVRPMEREQTVVLLDELAARFEADLAPKAPWTRAKMNAAHFESLLGGIVGFEMRVERLEGVTKLSQNKSADQVERAAAQLANRPDPAAGALAEMMRQAASLKSASAVE